MRKGALLFGWSPFVVFRAVGNGHNDIVMMAFALGLRLYVAMQGRWRWAMPLLALSILVKFSTALYLICLRSWCTRRKVCLRSDGHVKIAC